MSANVIPPITDPMGKYWDQPDPANILIDDTHALMDARTFRALHDYSYSQPTGVYPGKMWRAGRKKVDGETWWLKWFGTHEDPKMCSGHAREIIVV